MLEKLILASARYPTAVIVFWSAVALASVIYAVNFARINSDLSTLIRPSDDLSWNQDNEYYKQQFPLFSQTALVVVSGADARQVKIASKQLVSRLKEDDGLRNVFAPGLDEFVEQHQHYFLDQDQLAQWLRGVEYAYGPTLRLAEEASIANFVFILADHLTVNRGLPLPPPIESIAQGIVDSDFNVQLTPALVDDSSETHYQLVLLQGKQNLDEQLPNAAIVARLRQIVSQLPDHQEISIRLTGEIPLAHEEIQAALNGVEIAGLISIVLLALILGFGIRSIGFVMSIFALLTVGVAITLALAVLLVGAFNTLSLIFVVMFFGLGVDFAVHFGLRIREARQSFGDLEAYRLAAKDTAPALLLCMLTSSIAFLSFAPTAYIGLGELGIVSALGMIVAFALSLSLLVALLSKLDSIDVKDQFSLSFLSLPPAPTLLIFAAVVTSALFVAKDAEFDYSVLAMRDVDTEGMRTLLELQEAKVTTDYSISVLVKNDRDLIQLVERLEALPEVGGVTSPLDLIPTKQSDTYRQTNLMADRFDTIDAIVAAQENDLQLTRAAVEYLQEALLYLRDEDRPLIDRLVKKLSDLDQAQLQQGNDELYVVLQLARRSADQQLRAKPFLFEDIPHEYRARLISEEGDKLVTVQPKADLVDRQAATRFIEAVSSVAPNIAGRSVVEWGVGSVVVESFLQAMSLALFGILLVLTVYFKSLLMPVLVMIPVAITLVLTMAIGELTGLSLNMANILVVPLIIGLGVDTGIHVVHRYRSDQGQNLFQSSTAKAVVISALTTIGTFFSLSFSPHLGAASIGLLLTVAISVLVVVTFVLLPVLLDLMVKNRYPTNR